MSTLIVSGAFGKDYATEDEAIAAWNAGDDFRIRNINVRGTYVSNREVGPEFNFIQIRFNNDSEIAVIEWYGKDQSNDQ